MKYLKENWLLLAIIVLAVIALVIVYKSCNKNKSEVKDIKRNEDIKAEQPKITVDKQGRTHAEVREMHGSSDALRMADARFDSVLHVLKIREKQVRALTFTSTVTSGEVRTIVKTVHDTVNGLSYRSFDYADKWLRLDGTIYDSTALIDYKIFDSLASVTYVKKAGFMGLGKKETYIDVWSLNPASKVSGVTGMRVATETPKRFGIGPFVGMTYTGKDWVISGGIALQYSIIKF